MPLPRDSLVPERRQGTVTAVVSTYPPVATVQLGGDTSVQQDMVCVASYAPVVGDVVWLLSNAGDHLVIGAQPVGTSALLDLPLGTSVANYGAPYLGGKYSKGPGGIVVLEGLIRTSVARGVGTTWATLPVGYRPTAIAPFWTWLTGTGVRVEITSAGAITTPTVGAVINDYLSLGGITFVAEQ